MRLLGYTFIIGFLTFSYGCQKDNIIELGEIELEESSKDMIPYEGEEVLMFRDSTGDALRVVGDNIVENKSSRGFSTCLGGSFFNSNCETVSYSATNYSIQFTGSKRSQPNRNIMFYLSVIPKYQGIGSNAPDDYVFFDEFRINFSGEDFFNLRYIVDDKGRKDIETNHFYNNFREEQEVVLLGERFEDIIVFLDRRTDEEQLYYSKEKGIIGFVEGNGTTWVLDN